MALRIRGSRKALLSSPPFRESEREGEGESEKGSSQRERERLGGKKEAAAAIPSLSLCPSGLLLSPAGRPAARRDLVRGCHEKIHLVGKVHSAWVQEIW